MLRKAKGYLVFVDDRNVGLGMEVVA
jgi:hypothetical protein